MTIVSENSSPKLNEEGIFDPEFYTIFFFGKILQLDKFEGVNFKYDNSFLKLLQKNNQIRQFWFHIWALLFSCITLKSDKFEGADFFFKVLAKHIPK